MDLLGPFMQLLEFLSINKELNNYLAKVASPLVETTSKSETITNEDLPKVSVINNTTNVFIL